MKRLLQQLASAGEIGWLSLHFADFIASRSAVDIDHTLSLSAARLCEASQQGSVWIDLAELGDKPLFSSNLIDAASIPRTPATAAWCKLLLNFDCVG